MAIYVCICTDYFDRRYKLDDHVDNADDGKEHYFDYKATDDWVEIESD